MFPAPSLLKALASQDSTLHLSSQTFRKHLLSEGKS